MGRELVNLTPKPRNKFSGSSFVNAPQSKNFASSQSGFTRIDLLVIILTLFLLAILVWPSFGKSREGGHEAVCINNLRQLGITLMAYSGENNDAVPEEGNAVLPIVDIQNADAWYNFALKPNYPRLVDLYQAGNPPLPGNGTVFSCPSTLPPNFTYANPPNVTKAFFMYGMSGRICINKSTRSTGVKQTQLSTIPQPQNTIFMAEVDPNSPSNTGPAQSNVTGQYATARHQRFGIFTMADGHVRSAGTNDFLRNATESNSATVEWAVPRKMYWHPTPTTPN